jgi:hypothetical protein
MWGIFFVVIGFLGLFFINLFEDITSTNDQNYYLLKETTQAAMFDSIDLALFRNEGKLRIVKEKFVENFTRRFSQSTNIQKNYNIKFREIIEEPPKVTIEVGSSSRVTFTEEDFDINIKNVLDAILETTWDGSLTNPNVDMNCSIEFIPGYLKEIVTYKTITRVVGQEKYNCREVCPSPPYEIRYKQKCKTGEGKVYYSYCPCSSSIGNLSKPGCTTGWPDGQPKIEPCKSCSTKCDTRDIVETEIVPITTKEYVPPEYKLNCN